MHGRIYVAGTCDTKGDELRFVCRLLQDAGLPYLLVDLGIKSDGRAAAITPQEIAAYHPAGPAAVFLDDRGAAVQAMGAAFRQFVRSRGDIAAIIGLGGSGGTSMIAPAMQELPIGVPKIMVSAVAASDIRPYIGLADIAMLPSVTDIDRVNRISRLVIGNAVNALIGMMTRPLPVAANDLPAIGITTAGVTTECQDRVMDRLSDRYECLSFHAAGTGGPTMEKLAESGLLAGMIDVAPTEITDLVLGGAFACSPDRLDGVARTGLPYVAGLGAMDCWKFRAPHTVPAHLADRVIHAHNPEVTLVRPNEEELGRVGAWIADKLNKCDGPVRLLMPRGGLSSIDRPTQPFYAPTADDGLFRALMQELRQTEWRRLIDLPYHVNDPEFAEALVVQFQEAVAQARE